MSKTIHKIQLTIKEIILVILVKFKSDISEAAERSIIKNASKNILT